jgi:hypothetical protein
VRRNKTKILIWLLSWAALLLLVIYSPIGSPELYRHDNYVVYNQSVNFNGAIANAPSSHSYQSDEQADLQIPTYTTPVKAYTVNSSAAATSTTGKTNYSVTSTLSNHVVTTQNTGGASGGSGFLFMSSHSSAQGRPTIQTNGITTLNTDLASAVNPTSTRQFATEGTTDGGTDPGGDPTGPPIPVGDGFWILLLLAGGYAIEKMISKNKTF